MNFKEKYKKIKNFKKILNSPIALLLLFIMVIFSSLGYSIYHNYNLYKNYNYQPFKEYIDTHNLNITYESFNIQDNDEKIYNPNRIFSILNNKFKEIEKNILIESQNFTKKNLAANYLKYADKDEIKFSSITQYYTERTIFSQLYSNSLFFEKNNQYVIYDKEKNISQSQINLNQNYYEKFDSLIKIENDLEYVLYQNFDDEILVIEKQKEKFIFTVLNKKDYIISKLFVIEKDGDIFISQSDNTLAYSKINIQKNVANIKNILDENIFLKNSAFAFLFFIVFYCFLIVSTNFYLYLHLINHIKKKNKNNTHITCEKKVEKEIQYVE